MRVVPADYQKDISPHVEDAHAEDTVDLRDLPTRQWFKLINNTGTFLGCIALNRNLPKIATVDGLYVPPEHRGKGYTVPLVAEARQQAVDDLSLDRLHSTIIETPGRGTPYDKYDWILTSLPLTNGSRRLTVVRELKLFRGERHDTR
jgi:hypothetical protein